MAKFNDGIKASEMTRSTDKFCNERGIFIEFYHLPSKQTVSFKAYVTQFADNYEVQFKKEDVYGRLDPIAIYQGTSRNIQLAWTLVAETEQEAYENLRKAQQYVQMLYPSYKNFIYGKTNTKKFSASTLSTPPLLKLKFMNLISKFDSDADRMEATILRGEKQRGTALNTEGRQLERDITIDFGGTGNAREDGLLVIPGNMTMDPQLADRGAMINGKTAIPFEIQMSSQYTVLHEHDLGFSKDFKYIYGNTRSARQLSQIKELRRRMRNPDVSPSEVQKELKRMSKLEGYTGSLTDEAKATQRARTGKSAALRKALRRKKKEPGQKRVLKKITERDTTGVFDIFPYGSTPAVKEE